MWTSTCEALSWRRPAVLLPRGEASRPAHHGVRRRRGAEAADPSLGTNLRLRALHLSSRRDNARIEPTNNPPESHSRRRGNAHGNEALTDRPPAPAIGRRARQSLTRADAIPVEGAVGRLAALEMRASFEFMAFMASSPIAVLMPRGDGHPVMVLPPFIGDDAYTAPLRWVLEGQGYAVHGWRQGTNLSRTRKIVDGLPRWLLELHERHGAKVSLVGHSGGGNWARDLAREYPFAVRQVITLGAPFRLRPGDATQADQLADMLLKDQVPEDPSALIDEEDRPPRCGSGDLDLQPHRRRRPLAGGPRIGRAAAGEHRSDSAATAGSATTRRRVRRRRPPRPARRRMAALPPTDPPATSSPPPPTGSPPLWFDTPPDHHTRHVLDTTRRDLATGRRHSQTRRGVTNARPSHAKFDWPRQRSVSATIAGRGPSPWSTPEAVVEIDHAKAGHHTWRLGPGRRSWWRRGSPASHDEAQQPDDPGLVMLANTRPSPHWGPAVPWAVMRGRAYKHAASAWLRRRGRRDVRRRCRLGRCESRKGTPFCRESVRSRAGAAVAAPRVDGRRRWTACCADGSCRRAVARQYGPWRPVLGVTMQQSSGMDASFVYLETPSSPMHVAGLSIYDPSTAPGGKVTFKGILADFESASTSPARSARRWCRYRWNLDHPYWVEDRDFDLEFHVRHIVLPQPGDWRQLCILAARLHSRMLDLSRPLWETYVIEGLDNVEGVPPGSFALLQKTHHAAIDGVSGMEMT